MKILLLGATGRTGKYVLEELLYAAFEVVCLVRDVSNLPIHENLKPIKGDVSDLNELQSAAKSCHAIINVLNISRTSDFPWSPLRTPKDLLSKVMSNIMILEHKPKVILCSAWGVTETKKDIPFWFRWLIDISNIGVAYCDHEKQEALLEKSQLDWVIIRPVGLTNSQKMKNVIVTRNNSPKPSLVIGRRSLANFLVSCIKSNDLVHQKLVVSNS